MFSLCVTDIFSKHVWVVPLKDKEGTTINNAFQNILDKSKRKPKKMWVDKGNEFYNKSKKCLLQDNIKEMYSIHNEENSVVGEILKTKIYKYITLVSKKVYIDKLDDIVNKYSNTYHSTIKMKPINNKDNTYFDFDKKVMKKILNFRLVIM